MGFFKSRTFLVMVLLQIAGPLLFTFGNWANVIQYLSGFGMAYALWEFPRKHKRELNALHERLDHIHREVKR